MVSCVAKDCTKANLVRVRTAPAFLTLCILCAVLPLRARRSFADPSHPQLDTSVEVFENVNERVDRVVMVDPPHLLWRQLHRAAAVARHLTTMAIPSSRRVSRLASRSSAVLEAWWAPSSQPPLLETQIPTRYPILTPLIMAMMLRLGSAAGVEARWKATTQFRGCGPCPRTAGASTADVYWTTAR